MEFSGWPPEQVEKWRIATQPCPRRDGVAVKRHRKATPLSRDLFFWVIVAVVFSAVKGIRDRRLPPAGFYLKEEKLAGQLTFSLLN
jgi:hypothetical protein